MVGGGDEGEAAARRGSLAGRLLFSWFDRYVAKGKAKALTADEIPVLEEEFRYASECEGKYSERTHGKYSCC